jgi:hypothetical protein
MFVVLWEFEVKPGNEDCFERVYGPGGDWDTLFQRSAGHAETRLLRDIDRKGVYLTADYWHSSRVYEQFLNEQRAEYQRLDAACANLTTSERKMGAYEIV